MNKTRTIQISLALLAIAGAAVALSAPKSRDAQAARIERGRYIVASSACNDCHTPKKFGANGPELDLARLLSGHPQDELLPPAPKLPEGPWMVTTTGGLTAWSGPWGTSFPANLTPDDETGLGRWTEQDFIATIRTGRHMGRGRAILPPMPVEVVANLTDEDLGAVFAYLHSIPAVSNRVPQPLPPAAE